jgi:GT2 family glycosyltransferase
MPVHDPDPRDLERAIDSVRRQTWPYVELCLVDDGCADPVIQRRLRDLAKEPGVRFRAHARARGIAGATNAALELVQGDFVLFLDHDDELTPDALSRVADALRAHPEADFVYSDHDLIDSEGGRLQTVFKPDWSPELLLSYMYVGHLKCARASLVEALGGFRQGFEGAADHDFLLRLAERTDRVVHVPEVLCHWRAAENSMAWHADTKTHAFESGRRAVDEALRRRGIEADAEWPDWAQRARIGVYRSRFRESADEKVSILIPTRDRVELLRDCIASIEERTEHPSWEIVILDNESRDPETLEYFERTPHRVVRVPGEFNFSRIVNRGVEACDGELVVLLNNDTLVVSRDWLRELAGQLRVPGVGAVGAKLLYPDGRIQHAGVTLGVHGLTGHAFDGHPDSYTPLEYGFFAHVCRNVSAVTAACLITRRDIWAELGGFDETELGVAWNDTDFCLRLVASGRRVVLNPYAELIHLCSASRGDAKNDREVGVMFDRWSPVIERDPYYNPNLSRLETDFRPRTRIDERPFFYYTPEGFRAHPPGTSGGAVSTTLGVEGPQAPSAGILAEICVSQEQAIDRLHAQLIRFERADRVLGWLASRPILGRLRRSGLAGRVWSIGRRVKRSPRGARWLRRLGLIA